MKSELRQNLVSGDWVLVAPGRGKKPDHFKESKKREKQPKQGCVFENPKKAGGGKVLLSYPNNKSWRLQIVPNKYPAVTHGKKEDLIEKYYGPFKVISGFGYHELLITRGHTVNFPKLGEEDALLVFKAFRERYLEIAQDKNLSYVSIFHNWGLKAGASVYHPHYQILGIPVIPPSVSHSLKGSAKYMKKYNKCAHCEQIAWEKKQKKRIIFENKHAIAFIPFASKEPFEIRVTIKKHTPFFEDTKDVYLLSVTKVLRRALQKLEKALNKPDYNFFIHTAPVRDKNNYNYYHWHIEAIPRTNISAGFELGTDIEINPLDPDAAAKFLRKN